MGKSKVVGVRIEPEKWERFRWACERLGRSPHDVLRELIEHVDVAINAVESLEITQFDGDLAAFLRRRFPRLKKWQWQLFADVFNEIAEAVPEEELNNRS